MPIKIKLIAAMIGGFCTMIGGGFTAWENGKELRKLRNKK